MNFRTIGCGVISGALMLVSGAAFSGGQTTTTDQLMDFDTSSGKLWAFPHGKGLTTYLHKVETEHLAVELSRFLPPDPCLPIARAWNFTVQFDEKNRVRSTLVFEVLLVLLSDFQCRATIVNTDGSPRPLLRITPTAK